MSLFKRYVPKHLDTEESKRLRKRICRKAILAEYAEEQKPEERYTVDEVLAEVKLCQSR